METPHPEAGLVLAASPLAGVKQVEESMSADDLALFLVFSERQSVLDYLRSLKSET